jgi:prophage regulatory protein
MKTAGSYKHLAHTAGDTGGTVHEIFRRGDLTRITGLSIPYIYELISKGEFPKPIKLGERASGWISAEVAAWQARRIAARDGKAA